MPSSLARFLASGPGRGVRIGAGVMMLVAGLRRGGVGGAVVSLVGLVPLTCGALDFCLISYLFGGPFRGQEIRE